MRWLLKDLSGPQSMTGLSFKQTSLKHRVLSKVKSVSSLTYSAQSCLGISLMRRCCKVRGQLNYMSAAKILTGVPKINEADVASG